MNSTAFTIAGIDAQGRVSTRQVEAPSVEDARRIASSSGLEVLRCDPVRSLSSRRAAALFTRLSKDSTTIDVVAFSQDMATLMDAGVTVKEAVRALAIRESSSARRHVFEQLDNAVSEGLSFSAALARTESFPALLVATIAASEQTGDLAVGLSRYARHQHSIRAVRDKVIGACVYPLLLLAVGSLVVAMLLGVVVPRFTTLIGSTGRELPFMSSVLMSWGRFVDAHPLVPIVAFAGLVIAIAVCVFQWRKPQVRRVLLDLVPRAPVSGLATPGTLGSSLALLHAKPVEWQY